MLVLAYENTVLEIGTEKFINFCLENDLKDILLVGLSNNEVKDQIIEAGLQVSCYVELSLLKNQMDLFIFRQNLTKHRKKMKNIQH